MVAAAEQFTSRLKVLLPLPPLPLLLLMAGTGKSEMV